MLREKKKKKVAFSYSHPAWVSSDFNHNLNGLELNQIHPG